MYNPITPLEPWDKVSNSEPLRAKRLNINLSLGDWQSLLRILETYTDTDLPDQQECKELHETINLLYMQKKIQYIHIKNV